MVHCCRILARRYCERLCVRSLNNNQLNKLPSGIFSNNTKLRSLSLDSNQLRKLPSGIFSSNTELEYMLLSDNPLRSLPSDIFAINTKLIWLYLSEIQLHHLPPGIFDKNTQLRILRLNDNDMKGLNGSAFKNLTMLEELWLQDNNFTELPPNLFQDLKSLKELYLSNNKLKSLPDGLFNSLSKLTYLKMEYNKIKKLHEDQFQGLVELLDLYLSENKIEALPDKIFKGVKKLRSLNIFGNRIQNVTSTTFNYAHELRMLTLDTNLMCCHLDLFRQDADCEYSFNDNFASCHSMFRHHAPRRTLWIVGLLSLLGSLFVVGWQYFYPDNNVVQSIMLVNLGVSDGIMGIYLIIIGIKDLQWSGEYYLHDYEWRTGWFCHFNGAMSVFSSEVSVMMISLIALDRLKNIVFPYTFAKITLRQTCLMCVVIWLVGGVMAFLPLSGMHYFSEWYYGNNVVCLPLQLSPELQEGWEYSTSMYSCIF